MPTDHFFFFWYILESTCDMIITAGNGHIEVNSNPRGDCISQSTNTLVKGMNPTILPPAMVWFYGISTLKGLFNVQSSL